MVGTYTRVRNIKSLRCGDHVAIWDFSRWPISYQHHGIVYASGASESEIKIWHVWSPLTGRAAHEDSCAQISTLSQFLWGRKASHLRLVEYHTSKFRDIWSKWGEVHLTKADTTEVILARCNFLLGLGKGNFNLLMQNCEHAAHWCMTGEQWCKQALTKAKGRVPFEDQIPKEHVENLYKEIARLKAKSLEIVEEITKLEGTEVYLRLNGNSYVKTMSKGNQVGVVPACEDGEPKEGYAPTRFKISCRTRGYNCLKITFFDEETQKYMYSRSTASCFREIQMKKFNFFRGKDGLTWEYSLNSGAMKSMNQHRRFIGVREGDNKLIDVSIRGDGARFEIIPASKDINISLSSRRSLNLSRKLTDSSSISNMKSSVDSLEGKRDPMEATSSFNKLQSIGA